VAFVASGRRGRELPGPAADHPMRGLVEGLPSPRAIGTQLPAALQEDEFCQRMMTAFDDVLAPIFNTLDCFETYLDPQLAPPDFVAWLAGWVGVEIDETWTLDRLRRLIQDAVILYRVRGTAAGLAAHIKLYAGVTPEIEDSGGSDWSETADTPLPGSAQPRLTVRLRVEDPASVRSSTVSRIIDSDRPAHLPFQLEILVHGDRVEAAEEEADPTAADAEAPGAVDLPGSERIELAPQGPLDVLEQEAAEAPGAISEAPDATAESLDATFEGPEASAEDPEASAEDPGARAEGHDAEGPDATAESRDDTEPPA
jgi:phage tail-like protein